MKTIYMNHTLHLMNSRGIELNLPKGAQIRQEETYIIITENDTKEKEI